jgi:hypothetical protein
MEISASYAEAVKWLLKYFMPHFLKNNDRCWMFGRDIVLLKNFPSKKI